MINARRQPRIAVVCIFLRRQWVGTAFAYLTAACRGVSNSTQPAVIVAIVIAIAGVGFVHSVGRRTWSAKSAVRARVYDFGRSRRRVPSASPDGVERWGEPRRGEFDTGFIMVRIGSRETHLCGARWSRIPKPAVVCVAKAPAMSKSLRTIVFSVPLVAMRLELEVAK